MTKRSLASLCIKLMAVYLIASNVMLVLQNLSVVFMAVDTSEIWVSVVMVVSVLLVTVIWLSLGLLLIGFSDTIARKLVQENEDPAVISISDEDLLYRVFFVCLGLAITIQALPSVSRLAVELYGYDQLGFFEDPDFTPYILREVLPIAVQLALGVFLMIRPVTVLGWIKNFQPRENSLDDDCNENPDHQPQED